MQTDWVPLLDGALRDRALEAVLAIADALRAEGISSDPRSAADADAASLADGDAGLAIFFAYLAQAGLTDRGFEPAERLLDDAQAAIFSAEPTIAKKNPANPTRLRPQRKTNKIWDFLFGP